VLISQKQYLIPLILLINIIYKLERVDFIIKLKSIKLVILILLVPIIITGCSSSNTTNDINDNGVWEPFSTTDFGIMYPGDWFQYNRTYEDLYGFFSVNPDNEDLDDIHPSMMVLLLTDDVKSGLSESEFYDMAEGLSDVLVDENKTLISESKTRVDSEPGYQIITEQYEYGEKDIRQIYTYTFKDNNLFMLVFSDRISNFDDSKEINNRMIDSFEFL